MFSVSDLTPPYPLQNESEKHLFAALNFKRANFEPPGVGGVQWRIHVFKKVGARLYTISK